MPDDTPPLRRPSDCLAEDWLRFLGHRWNALTLWQLTKAPRRFFELQAALPDISPKVLTERLNALAARQLVERRESNTYPREVTYALTARGQSLGKLVAQLHDWAQRDAEATGAAREDTPGKDTGRVKRATSQRAVSDAAENPLNPLRANNKT